MYSQIPAQTLYAFTTVCSKCLADSVDLLANVTICDHRGESISHYKLQSGARIAPWKKLKHYYRSLFLVPIQIMQYLFVNSFRSFNLMEMRKYVFSHTLKPSANVRAFLDESAPIKARDFLLLTFHKGSFIGLDPSSRLLPRIM